MSQNTQKKRGGGGGGAGGGGRSHTSHIISNLSTVKISIARDFPQIDITFSHGCFHLYLITIKDWQKTLFDLKQSQPIDTLDCEIVTNHIVLIPIFNHWCWRVESQSLYNAYLK